MMHTTDDPGSAIDALLADAEILSNYDHSRAPTAAERIARAATRELDLISAKVLNGPEASKKLSKLDNSRQIDPEGALVFACLLYIVGRENGARFWWQFAAGGGSSSAATCLSLQHRRNGAFADADYWREQADRLPGNVPACDRAPAQAAQQPLLPDHVAKELLAQCGRGLRPRLPAELEEVIKELAIENDPDFGGIPKPSPLLRHVLGADK
jgi:hypothetical protein